MIKRTIKYFALFVLTTVASLALLYLVAPNWVQDTAVDLLYPTVTIEEKYRNNFTVEIPRVYELMYIACSLTPTFRADDNLISNRSPTYRAAVTEHFSAFHDHPLVNTLESKLKENPYSQLQPAIRMFSLNYQLTKENTLAEEEIFHVNPILIKLFKSKIFYYPDYLELIEDFAAKTDFYRFYYDHEDFYASLKTRYENLCDPNRIWNWMEDRSSEEYNSYRIIFSPLTGGFHNTIPGLRDTETGLQQTWMFVSPPPLMDLDTLTERELEVMVSKFEREVFTEIDHNYVNPTSDKYVAEIERAMPDYREWNHQKKGYSSSVSTFNEYVTWGLFSLYASDVYRPGQVDTIISLQEDYMVDKRKFVHFKAFNREMRRLYAAQKNEVGQFDIESLYVPLIQWMQQKSPKANTNDDPE
ncbi:MAG: DUF4932 domain-containing protein [Bacteroidota bacterium]